MNNKELFQRACRVIPGGVNSPVRAFAAVGGEPVFIRRGRGSRVWAEDGRALIDFCGSWGALILGHSHPAVVEAVRSAVSRGTGFGAPTAGEVELAELLCSRIPGLEMVRLVSSGTEAAMTAIRLARGYTGREKILKFDGGYHGPGDPFLISAGSGLLTSGVASSAGVPAGVSADTLVVPYNDLAAAGEATRRFGPRLAAVIVEPAAANMGLVPAEPGFLEGLRRLTEEVGALLVFDEVITGFRFGPTTLGTLLGITPDLTCLGKIIGGGLPVGAVGGRSEVMERLAPNGPVYQAGTLSGNPVAVAAGLATLRVLIEEDPYPELDRLGRLLAEGMERLAAGSGRPVHCRRLGGVFTVFFGPRPVRNREEAARCDTAGFGRFFHRMLGRGIYLPPSQFEAAFISAAHREEEIGSFLAAAGEALAAG